MHLSVIFTCSASQAALCIPSRLKISWRLVSFASSALAGTRCLLYTIVWAISTCLIYQTMSFCIHFSFQTFDNAKTFGCKKGRVFFILHNEVTWNMGSLFVFMYPISQPLNILQCYLLSECVNNDFDFHTIIIVSHYHNILLDFKKSIFCNKMLLTYFVYVCIHW